jgi:iron complex outermembrane recepter protein
MPARYPRHRQPRRAIPWMIWALTASCVARAGTIAQHIEIAIPAGRAIDSVRALARQTNLNILLSGQLAGDVMTNAIHGSFTPADAVTQIIAGTSLAFAMADEHTVTIWSCAEFRCAAGDSIGSDNQKRHDREAGGPSQGIAAQREISDEQVDVNGVRTPMDDYAPQLSLQKVVVSKRQIEQNGALTLPGALGTLTQVLSGGVTEGNIRNGREALTNGNHATGVNIRGLGPAATLILLNGHRTVKGGTDAMYTESDMFPMEGLQSVELFLDGPPLQYGGDAIGGALNIVMNRHFTGRSTAFQSNGLNANARREYRLGHIQGWKWGDTHFELAMELRQQNTLSADKRIQYRNDLTRFGGSDFRTPYSQPGTILAGSQTYRIPANQDGTDLTPSSFTANTENLTDQLAGSNVFPRQRRWNAYIDLDHDFGDGVSGFLTSLCSYRQVTANAGAYTAAITVDQESPFYVNPTGGTEPINILYRFGRELGAMMERARVTTCDSTFELDAKNFRGWHLNGSFGYGTETQKQTMDGLVDFSALRTALLGPRATAFNPFGDGSHADPTTVDSFRSSSESSIRTDQWDVSLLADRSTFALPAGDVNLGLGVEYRREMLKTVNLTSKSAPLTAADLARNVHCAFGQLMIPIVGRNYFSASGRFDHYSDFGSVLSPEYALTLVPTQSLAIRGSWARLFRPPNISQLVENNNFSQIQTLPDAQSPSGTTAVLIDSGKNAQLKQERSTNWAVTIELAPATLPNFRASLNYFHINSRDRIEDLLFRMDVLDNPEYRSAVNRNPTDGQRQAICNHGVFAGSPTACLSSPIGAIVDLRTVNTATLTTSGLDLHAMYAWRSAWGELEADLSGTYVFDFSAAATADSPKLQLRNTPNNPIDLRVRPALLWKLPRFTALLAVNYSNRYRDNVSIPNRSVASWTTVDMQVSYTVAVPNASWLDETDLLLTATNMLDRDPPFVNNELGVGYDLLNGNLRGRAIGVTLRKKW